ncbi:hypothetical protein C7B61_03230 [filamentous cyanobacterium CCP1]|nr:hypothetical protein C7B76_23550 [filamentous cyanobacterium CCP2]PSB67994.1 hypothetical protein C7B61_03230 [filamentous cyanobacterium CCP1]
MTAFFIVVLGLTPSILSIWMMRRADARAQERLRLAIESVSARRLPSFHLPPEHQYVEGVGYVIGDFSCKFNARSSYIRCAVNPFGPCEGCSQYQERE